MAQILLLKIFNLLIWKVRIYWLSNLDLNNFNNASLNIGIENLNKTELLNIISELTEGSHECCGS